VPAFSLPDKQLIPEGIAVDVKTGDFFVSSLAQWKVVKRNQSGSIQDFVGANQDGIWSTLGMKVDPTGKELWVCSAAEFDSLNGYSGIFVFDLKTRALKRKLVLDNKAWTAFVQ
jgi:DNA-binding beta-propeller fold protein YncE